MNYYQVLLNHFLRWHKADILKIFLLIIAAYAVVILELNETSDSFADLLIFGVLIASALFYRKTTMISFGKIEAHSFKFLSALPLNRGDLVRLGIFSTFLQALPLALTFALFAYYAKERAPLYLLGSIVGFVLLGLCNHFNQINAPRTDYFRKKHASNVTNAVLIKAAGYLAIGLYLLALLKHYDLIGPEVKKVLLMIGSGIDHFFDLFHEVVTSPAVIVVMAAVSFAIYHSILRYWENEKLSYPKKLIQVNSPYKIGVVVSYLGLFAYGFTSTAPEFLDSPLLAAVDLNDQQEIQRLLNEGHDVHVKSRNGRSAIVIAVQKANLPLFVFLQEKGASLSDTLPGEKEPQDILQLALNRGSEHFVLHVLNSGFPVSKKHDLLNEAAHKCMPELVDRLISEKYDVNAQDKDGHTPLHHSSMSNCIVASAALLDAGADLLIKDAKGKLAVDYTHRKDHRYYYEKRLRSPAGN